MDVAFAALKLGFPVGVRASSSGMTEVAFPKSSIITFDFLLTDRLRPIQVFRSIQALFMKSCFKTLTGLLLVLNASALPATYASDSWHVLFDGDNLEGWRSNEETPDVFTVLDNGVLRVQGGRAHLFWEGTDSIPAEFDDFEFKATVKTTEGANSGIFFHTKFQESGWPRVGLEAQVNTSHGDSRKTGSLYAIQDVLDNPPSKDGEWFDYCIRVEGRKVTVFVDGVVVNTYMEPDDPTSPWLRPNIRLGQGTFAIQGHDPDSTVFYRDIRVRKLGGD